MRHDDALSETSQILLQRIAEDASGPVAVCRAPDWHIVYANRAFLRLIGAPWEAIDGMPLAGALPGLAAAQGSLHLAEAARTGKTIAGQRFPMVAPANGPTSWWDYDLHPLPAPDGSFRSVLFTGRESTAEVAARRAADAAEAALARRSEQMRLAIHAARMYFWDWNIATGVIEWSEGLEAACGLAPGGFGGSLAEFRALVHPDDLPRVDTALGRALAGEADYDVEFRMRRADGGERWVLARGTVLRDARGAPTRVVGIDLDITERRAALAELHASRDHAVAELSRSDARFRTYFDHAPDCQFHVAVAPDGQFRYEAINPIGLTFVGLTMEEVRGRTPLEILGPDKGGMMTEGLRRVCETRQPLRYEASWHQAGQPVIFDAIYIPLFDGAGKVSGILGNARDITERRQVEAALRQAQKMEAIGQLTGGIAHDFNNLIAGISGSLELLQTRLRQQRTAEIGRYAVAAMEAVQRASSLTHRLLTFARRQALDPRPTDVNRLVTSLEELIRRTVGPAIHVEAALAEGLWPTLCDANQLESALLNLCINARDAMPEGGRISIATENVWLDEPGAAGRDIRAGAYVSLSVADTGTGMSPDVLAQVFEPFFTTKPIGQGTGLGLSMVHGYVKQSGGHVCIRSALGEGTRVRLFLPRHEAVSAEAAAGFAAVPAREAPASATGETVMVVDDEATVRSVIAEVLSELGYQVVEAADGAAALRLLHAPGRVDLLVTDVGLPGLNGRQLAEAGRQRRPGLPVLFITGYAQTGAIAEGALESGMEMLRKPFALDGLSAKVQALVRGTAYPAGEPVADGNQPERLW
jgi:PAS domain S-box-containing protein